MHRLLILGLVLVALSIGMQAQYSNPQSGMASGQSQNMAGTKTVEGCLHGSNGSYTLTAKDGTMYQLSGDTAKLAEHVGHEVQITGMTSGSSADSTAGAASGETQQQTLEVKSMKHIAKTCKAAMSQ